MKNKYKEIYNKIEIDENMKGRILSVIESYPQKLRLSYSLGIIFILLLTVTCVNAKEILKKWGGIIRETENNKLVLEDERLPIATNVDNMVIEESIYSEFMEVSDIKIKLGINFLSFNNGDQKSIKNSNYVLWSYMPNDNNKVQNITITQYGDKANMTAYILTKNFPMDKIESFNYDNGYDYKDLMYIDTITLDNLAVDAIIYTKSYAKEDINYEAYYIEFSYENIKYILSSTTERTLEEMLEILSTLKK